MLLEAIKEYTGVTHETDGEKYELYVRKENKKRFFQTKTEYQFFVISNNNEIDYQEVFSEISKVLEAKECTYFVFFCMTYMSEKDEFEKICNSGFAANLKRITLLNLDNGTLYLGYTRGIHNRILSRRAYFLLEEYNIFNKDPWYQEMNALFTVCTETMRS